MCRQDEMAYSAELLRLTLPQMARHAFGARFHADIENPRAHRIASLALGRRGWRRRNRGRDGRVAL